MLLNHGMNLRGENRMYDDILGVEEKKVTIKWDAVRDPKVIGYNLYYKEASQLHYKKINVGNKTSFKISIKPEVLYEFTVSAYSLSGESKHGEKVIFKHSGDRLYETRERR